MSGRGHALYPHTPGQIKFSGINAMEFIVFRGSCSNGEGIPQREAIALANGMEGNETLWVGKPVTMHCTPRTLREAAADLAASREYVRRRTLDRINEQRKKHAARMQRDVMEDPTSPRTPRGRGMVRHADRYVAEHHHRHQVGVTPQDRPLYAARENPERDGPERVAQGRLNELEGSPRRGARRELPFARQDAYPLEEMEKVYTSAQEDQLSDGSNELDDEYSSDEDPDDPIGYDTVAQRNRRRR